jgi:four helix bundle protein
VNEPVRKINSYKDLEVWKRSFRLALNTYKATERFPDRERYGLTSQIRRSAISVPSNIAEGFARNSRKDFVRFLRMANGSLFELQTQMSLAAELKYLSEQTAAAFENEAGQIGRMLAALIFKVSKSRRKSANKQPPDS